MREATAVADASYEDTAVADTSFAASASATTSFEAAVVATTSFEAAAFAEASFEAAALADTSFEVAAFAPASFEADAFAAASFEAAAFDFNFFFEVVFSFMLIGGFFIELVEFQKKLFLVRKLSAAHLSAYSTKKCHTSNLGRGSVCHFAHGRPKSAMLLGYSNQSLRTLISKPHM